MNANSLGRKLTARLLMSLSCACLAVAALAQDGKVYKIVNPDGSVSYSDRPPTAKGAAAKEMELGPGTSGIQSMSKEEIAETNARAQARLEEMERERQQAAQRAKEEEREKERAAVQQAPQEVYVPVYPYPRPRPRPHDGKPGAPGKDVKPKPPPEPTPPPGDLRK